MNNIIYISFHTGGVYKEVANEYLIPSLKKFQLLYKIYEKPNLKNWFKNVQYKAMVVLEALEEFKGKDLVFIDVDGKVLKFPCLFYEIPKIYDLGLFKLNWALHWRNEKGNEKRELCSGTMLIRNNDKVKNLVKQWIEKNKNAHEVEQKVLQNILEKNKELKIYNLPVEYCVIPLQNNSLPEYIKNKENEFVIYHYQYSRKIKSGGVKL